MTHPKDSEKSETPFRRFRIRKPGKRGRSEVWAKQMPEAFEVRVGERMANQAKSTGVRVRVKRVFYIAGNAGDYLTVDPETGNRRAHPRKPFESLYEPIDEQS